MKHTCEDLGICQGKGCGSCRPDLSSTAATYPFAPYTIEHSPRRQQPPSAMAYAKALLKVVRSISFFLFAVLFIYLAYWAPEIWADAQIKHARNVEAYVDACQKGAFE